MEVDDEVDHGKWSDLLDDLLHLIIDRLFSHSSEDCIRFGSVCSSWRSILVESNCIQRMLYRHRLPVLMIPIPASTNNNEDDYNVKNREEFKEAYKDTMNKRSFYSLKDKKVNNVFRLNVPDNRYCCGSSFGWLVTVDMDDLKFLIRERIRKTQGKFLIRLVNPFLPVNYNEIKLPSLRAFPRVHGHPVGHYWHLTKAVLSANPKTNTDDYIVMAIYSGMQRLAFCKRGDTHWTDVPTEWREYRFADVIYYEGLVHALDDLGGVVACDISDPKRQKIIKIIDGPVGTLNWTRKYIVESSGDLFQVQRNVRTSDDIDDKYFTDGIQVFKLQVGRKKPNWIKVSTLDGYAFFVGDNGSMSLLASDFPGCKPNSIYFTDDNSEAYTYDLSLGPHDMGIFNVEDQSFELHYQPTNSKPGSLWPTPIWVEPTSFLRIDYHRTRPF